MKKRGIALSTILYWVAAIFVLALVAIFSSNTLKEKLFEWGDVIKQTIRGG